MAADGWHIISHFTESRESARKLLRWLAETLQLRAAEIQFLDDRTSYRWSEKVERIPSGSRPQNPDDTWTHPFPTGESHWYIDGFAGDRNEIGVLLDLLADQWLQIGDLSAADKTKRQRQDLEVGNNRVTPAWIAVSRSARLIRSRIHQLSHSMRPLLILGETGTGKSHLASLIHRNGPTPTLPFSENLGPELTGTIYITDWQNLGQQQKQKILNDPRRLIAAAGDDPGAEKIRRSWNMETGGAGSILTIPPLRDRRADLPLLAGRFIENLVAGSGFPQPVLSPTALEALFAYPWPGNIGELKETISWALERCDSERISVGDLPPAVRGALQKLPEPSFPARLVALEYEALKEELTRQNGNMTRTARALGLTPRQVSWRVRKYGIDPRSFKSQQQTGP